MELINTLLKQGFALALFALAAISLFLLGCQRSIIYYPRGYSPERVSGSGAQLLRYSVEGDGEQVAFVLGPEKLPERIWIVCGGNGSVALDWEPFVSRLDETRAGSVLFELPGYGLSKGKADPASLRESMNQLRGALAANYGVSSEVLDSRVCFFGHSIGAASALIGAEEFGAGRVILISPFTTMTDMARRTVGWPLCYLNLHRYDNREGLRSLRERDGYATVFHGTDDGLVPIEMSRELAEEFSDIVTLTEVSGAGHNNLAELAGSALLEEMR